MSDEADHALAKRFDASMEAWHGRVEELENRFAAMQVSLDAFPNSARQRVTELEETVKAGIESLNKAARASAEDAKDIDFALQARMRQNYELLSEFVLRMGSVAGGSRPPEARDDNLPDPLSRAPSGAPGPDPAAGDRAWRWRDLVSDLREREAPAAPSEQRPLDASDVHDEVVRKAVSARRTSGIGAMREAVSNAMEGRIEELQARMERQSELKTEARRLVDELEPEISRAARQDEAAALESLLSDERGRAYLLASAALGDA